MIGRSDIIKTKSLVVGALIAALAYIAFAFFKIDIPVGASKTAFHLGNTFVVIGAFLLGGARGGVAGAIGLTLADLTSGYAIYAPTTFLLKLGIGIVCGFVAHRIGKLNDRTNVRERVKWTILASSAGMLFNIIFDPLFSFIRSYILIGLGVTQVNGKAVRAADIASLMAKWSALTTFVNAVLTIICATLIYSYLQKAFSNSDFIYKYKERGKND